MSDIEFDIVVDAPEVDLTVVDQEVGVGYENVEVIALLVEGPQGPPGPGFPRHQHIQTAPASTWTVSHPLGIKPAFVSVWVNDEPVEADIEILNTLTVVITFPSPTSGRVEIT